VKVGDLVRYSSRSGPWSQASWPTVGIVVRCIPVQIGNEPENVLLVHWSNGERCSYSAKVLEVLNESR